MQVVAGLVEVLVERAEHQRDHRGCDAQLCPLAAGDPCEALQRGREALNGYRSGLGNRFPTRRASHEFIVTLKNEAKELHVNAMDFAKALLDKGFHAPTTYFPLLVPECLLIEPTESETKEMVDRFVEALVEIREEAKTDSEKVKGAPYTTPVRRLDDVKAARQLDLAWRPGSPSA